MVVPLAGGAPPGRRVCTRTWATATGWNPYGTIDGRGHLPRRLRPALRHLPDAQLLHRDTRRALIEAGRIDGAGEWTLFRRVVIPLGMAAAASLAIFQFIWVWNDLLVALVFLGGDPHVPLTLFLYDQERTLAANFWIISTGSMVSIIVPAHRLLRLPALLRPRHARRRGEVRYLAEPSRSPRRQRLPGDMPDMMIAILNDMGFGDLNFHGGLGDARGRPPLGETPSPSSSPGWSTHIVAPGPRCARAPWKGSARLPKRREHDPDGWNGAWRALQPTWRALVAARIGV